MTYSPKKSELFANLMQSLETSFQEEEDKSPDLGTWAVKNNIVLDGREFSFKKHEYLIEPYKDTHPFQVEIKGTQLGLTSKALLRVFHTAKYGGSNYRGVGYYFPSRSDVTDLSKIRITSLIEDNPETIGTWIKETDAANVKKILNTALYLRGMKSRVGMKCHDDQTEVLTKNGWKFFRDVNKTVQLATLEPLHGSLEWQSPSDIYSYEYDGVMKHFVSNEVDFCVTGNHRLLVVSVYRTHGWLEANEANNHIEPFRVIVSLPKGIGRGFDVVPLPYSYDMDYKGLVYCASVPNGILYTRRNWCTLWSGNSAPMDLVVFDELDEAPPKSVDMIMERMAHSEAGEMLFLSNPTMPDYGIDKLWQTTDMKYWLLKCTKCNHYTNLVDTFPDCLLTVKGKVIRACEKCHSELDPSIGEWVAKRPQITERRGRQYSQLYSQTKMTAPDLILQTYRTTSNLTDFYNLKIGIAYVEAQNRLSMQEVLDCCGTSGIASESTAGTYMGVDQGNTLHVVIGKPCENRTGEVIYLGVHKGNDSKNEKDESGWFELDALMNRFKVVRCVVDALPNTKFARNFADRFRGRVYLNFYNEYQKGSLKWNDSQLLVSGNRTETLDASHNLITTQNIVLPRESDLMRTFALHLHNVAKKLEVDEETGSQRYTYLRLGEDHFRHAFNYFVMVLQGTPEFWFPYLM